MIPNWIVTSAMQNVPNMSIQENRTPQQQPPLLLHPDMIDPIQSLQLYDAL